MAGNNINFSFKLMRGQHLITDQRISIPIQNMKPFGGGKDDQETLENVACGMMFEMERAINSQTGFPLRCHIEQLPSDVPAEVTLDEDNIRLSA